MGFQFEQQNSEYYQQELDKQQNHSERDSFAPVLYLNEGQTLVRILPPAVGSGGLWMRQYKEHYLANAEPVQYYTCLGSVGEDCPVCEHAQSLLDEGKDTNNEKLIEQAKAFRPRVQFLANVFCYSSPDGEKSGLDKGVFVMKFGTMVKRDLLEFNQDVGGWADITNPLDGVDIKITRTGKGLSTKYTTMPQARRSNLQEQLAAQGLDLNNFELHNLNEVYPVRTYGELEAALNVKKATPVVSEPQVIQPVTLPTAQSIQAPAAPITTNAVQGDPVIPTTTVPAPVQMPVMPPPPPSVAGVTAPPVTTTEEVK